MSQIDWVEEESDLDNSTAEKSAEVIFVEEDREIGTKEISTVLSLVKTVGTDDKLETESIEETADTASRPRLMSAAGIPISFAQAITERAFR